MGTKYQEYKAAWDVSRALRQFQRADKDITKGYPKDAVKRMKRGLELVGYAVEHMAKAEEDAYNKASDEITKGNNELQKSIDDYANDKTDSGARHYNDAMNYYDKALDIID